VTDFEVVHEKIFHLFVLSDDLSYFAHEHPVYSGNGLFRFETRLPRPGAYRVVADCYPAGGTPQFLAKSFFTTGALHADAMGRAHLVSDLTAKQSENLRVELITEPPQPIAGQETLLFFRLSPIEGLEQYLGAWGHILIASEDLIDLIHDHPLYAYPEATDKPQVQFNVIFPRETTYRIFVQFQRRGVVNTAAFSVPVRQLR
jgi:hypothetical protein